MIAGKIELRGTTPADLETLFTYQADDEAAYMAAFVNENRKDRDAYMAKWSKHLKSAAIHSQTIVVGEQVLGSVLSYEMDGALQISYGLGRAFWGQGITTAALRKFLALFPDRPIFGRVAFNNSGSIGVLRKCGFKPVSVERHYSHARKEEIDEHVFVLE